MFAEEKWAIVFLALYIIARFFSDKHTIPFLKVASHWFRWLSFACFFSFLLVFFKLSFRPDWVHFISGIGLWFILETIFFRVSIQLLNLSEVPLFPKYHRDTMDSLWPINKRAIQIKEYLLNKSFKNLGLIKAELSKDLLIRQSMFLDASKRIRINVVFIPNAKQEVICYFSIFSLSEEGMYMITDNQNMPFGGFYPEHWSVHRYPLCHSLAKLLKKHVQRMNSSDTSWDVLEIDVLRKINQCQAELESINHKMGFFNYSKDEQIPRITAEGSHRICIEMWLLSYFGRTYN